eukprot:3909811-Rhodomonas_salina.4
MACVARAVMVAQSAEAEAEAEAGAKERERWEGVDTTGANRTCKEDKDTTRTGSLAVVSHLIVVVSKEPLYRYFLEAV